MKKGFVALILATVLLVQGQPAEAGSGPTLRAKITATNTTSERSVTAQPGGCNVVEEKVTWRNALGWRLFSLGLRARYCWQKAAKQWRLTQVLIVPKIWTAWWAAWSFEGFTADQTWGGVGQKEAGRHVVGKFRACVLLKVGPFCQEKYPWVQIRVFARGGFEQASGG
jgi:hypothetical protein